MTLVLPGSAQLAAGNRRVGWFALRTWFVRRRARAAGAGGLRAAPRVRLLAGLRHHDAAGAAARADGRRRRLGTAVLRRLADRAAADPGDAAPTRGRRRQRDPLPDRGERAAVRRAPGRRPTRLHHRDVRLGRGQRTPPRSLQRAAARRRRRRRPLGAAPGLPDGREHRRRDRPDGPDLAAAQHGELPVRPRAR